MYSIFIYLNKCLFVCLSICISIYLSDTDLAPLDHHLYKEWVAPPPVQDSSPCQYNDIELPASLCHQG